MKPAAPPSQARVLRRLFLTLMLRGRRKAQGRPHLARPLLGLVLTLLVFGLLGLVAFSFPRGNPLVFAGCLHALAFLLVGMNLALTSGTMLFNPEEADILLHRPIEPRVLLSAKVATIALFSMGLGVTLSLCGMAIGVAWTNAGWLFLPAHLVSLALEIVFCAGFIVLTYNLCLRWLGRERLENMMTGVQVVVAVGIMIAGQLLPRLLMRMDLTHARFPEWLVAFPPIWFASLDLLLTGGAPARGLLLPAALALAATAAAVWFGVVKLAGTYEQGLETLNETGPSAVQAGGHGRTLERMRRSCLVRWWLRDPVEAAAFRLTVAHLSRSRGVKLRVYPMLAQLLVYPLIIFMGGGTGLRGLSPYFVAYLGYFLAMLPTLSMDRLRLSEDYEAAAIFRQAPLARPSALFHGVRKGIIGAVCLPGLLIVLVAGAVWLHDARELLLIVPGLLLLPAFSLLPSIGGLFVPFSEPAEGATRGVKTTLLILLFQFVSFGLAGLTGWAWASGWFRWLLLVEAALAAAATLGLHALVGAHRFPDDD